MQKKNLQLTGNKLRFRVQIDTFGSLMPNQLKGKPHIKGYRTVLLAEDDLDDQEMLVEAMKAEDANLRFLIASTGSKALEMLNNLLPAEIPQLIILDYNLPEVSGAEILSRLKEMKRFDEVPKVIWSTSNSPVYQKKCMENGALSYIVKPTGIAGIRSIASQLVTLCSKP